jgi:hypothetical protein
MAMPTAIPAFALVTRPDELPPEEEARLECEESLFVVVAGIEPLIEVEKLILLLEGAVTEGPVAVSVERLVLAVSVDVPAVV